MNISDFFKGNELTKGQSDLIGELEQFLMDEDCSIFLLKGFAGVGKTFLTIGVTDYLKAKEQQFVLMAPTGKAAKVIASKTNKKAKTIHRVIYSYFDSDKKSVDSELNDEAPELKSRVKSNEDSPGTIYIIDEASMLSNQFNKSEACSFGSGYLLNDLLEYINLNAGNKKVIFIGDNAQLPPVRDSFSPALDNDYLSDHFQLNCRSFELTEVVRQKLSSGVICNANRLRRAMASNNFEDLSFDISADDVQALSSEEILERYLSLCKNKVEMTSDSIIIAYTNLQVRDYNNAIRAEMFGPEARLQVGEKIICVSNYRRDNRFISNGEFGRVARVLSGPEIRTTEVKYKTKKGRHSKLVDLCFIDVEIEFMDDSGAPYVETSKILTNLLYDASPRLNRLEYKALYVDFIQRNPHLMGKKNLIKRKEVAASDPYLNVLQIKFGYAITCHKSQGSEWPNVFVDTYFKNPKSMTYFRWLYTAITRTSKNLYINKNLNFGFSLS